MSKQNKSFSSRLSRFILVIGAVTIVLGLATNKYTQSHISPEKAAIFLVIVVVAAAIDSVWVKLILALSGLGFFLLNYVRYDLGKFEVIAFYIIVLLIMLFGFFVMFGGMRKK